jgi:copper resistance protein C
VTGPPPRPCSWPGPAAHPARTGTAAAALLVTLSVATAGPASAHAVLEDSRPAAGSVAPAAPQTVDLVFSEPPAGRAAVVVRDGCDRDVTREVTVADRTVVAGVAAGQPGAWSARYTVISDVDGHPTEGVVSFTVDGAPDCAAATGPESPAPAADDPADAPAAGAAQPAADGSGSAGTPTVPVLAGGVVLLLLGAVAARRLIR